MSEKSFGSLVRDAYGKFKEESDETIRKVADCVIELRKEVDHETAELLMEVAKRLGSLDPLVEEEVYKNLMRETACRTTEKFVKDFSLASAPLPSDEDDDEEFLDLVELLKEEDSKKESEEGLLTSD